MFSNRIYFKHFYNLIIAGLLSAGSESINSASIEKAQSMNKLYLQSKFRSKRALHGLDQESSAEYSFFLLFFDLVERIDTDHRVGYSTFFPDQVENLATGANN